MRQRLKLHVETKKIKYLESLGVYISLYTDGFEFPVHPDGIHTYSKDSHLAKELVFEDKELPQDLLERLAYYKPIMDKLLNE